MTQQRYTISDEHVILYGNPVCIAKVKPHLVAYMNILAHFTAQPSPDGWPQVFLIKKFKNICLESEVEDKTPPKCA
jgi:hypothetical protein